MSAKYPLEFSGLITFKSILGKEQLLLGARPISFGFNIFYEIAQNIEDVEVAFFPQKRATLEAIRVFGPEGCL
jgi:hypothetical protein